MQLVDHGQDDEHRQLAAQQLADERQRALERAGIGDDHQRVGDRHAGHSSLQHVAHDPLVGADRLEAVGARQIEHARQPTADPRLALASLDRDARIVPDPRAQARQRIEERGLAGVRAADQGEPERRRDGGVAHGTAIARTRMRVASLRRSASREPRNA